MISTIIIIVLLSLFAIELLINQYLSRALKVVRFRLQLLDMALTTSIKAIEIGEDDVEKVCKLRDKYSYEDMFYSLRPLTLEAWYTEEEIKILKGGEK